MYILHRFSPLWHIRGTGMPWHSSGYTIVSDLAGCGPPPWHFLYIDDVFLIVPSPNVFYCEDHRGVRKSQSYLKITIPDNNNDYNSTW